MFTIFLRWRSKIRVFGMEPQNSNDNDDGRNNDADAVLYHRWSVDRISPRRSGFKSKLVYVGFVLGKKWHLDRFLSK
jgi:hypothetical protein